MEIKVYKDVKKREKMYGGLTAGQIISIVAIIFVISIDILNSIFGFLPSFVIKPIEFLVLVVAGANAIVKPHGLEFKTWIKLLFKFNTTIQARTYQEEGIKQYSNNDFKRDKKIKETNF